MKRLILFCLCLSLILSSASILSYCAFADETNIDTITRSIDNKTYALDFSQYRNWRIDFDNSGGLLGNHHTLSVEYVKSEVNGDNAGSSTVYLYLEDLSRLEADGSYYQIGERLSIKPGETALFSITDSNDLLQLRLNFSCSGDRIGTFIVDTRWKP